MLTPLNIMSIDQGKEFARQEMKRIYAEPAEVAPEIGATETALTGAVARKPKWRSFFAEFIGLWETGHRLTSGATGLPK